MKVIFESYNVAELRKFASSYNKDVKIVGASKMKKADLINELMKHKDKFKNLKTKGTVPTPVPTSTSRPIPVPTPTSRPIPAPTVNNNKPIKKRMADKIKDTKALLKKDKYKKYNRFNQEQIPSLVQVFKNIKELLSTNDVLILNDYKKLLGLLNELPRTVPGFLLNLLIDKANLPYPYFDPDNIEEIKKYQIPSETLILKYRIIKKLLSLMVSKDGDFYIDDSLKNESDANNYTYDKLKKLFNDNNYVLIPGIYLNDK